MTHLQNSMAQPIAQLRSQGYNHDFEPTLGGIRCPETGRFIPAENLKVQADYSTGETNMHVYGIIAKNGMRGILWDPPIATPALNLVFAMI